jgi:predicted phage gp36 major capsid-like protein
VARERALSDESANVRFVADERGHGEAFVEPIAARAAKPSSPITIATQMPDVAPGSTPVAFGDFSEAYTIVERKAPTVLGRLLSHLQVRGTSRGCHDLS